MIATALVTVTSTVGFGQTAAPTVITGCYVQNSGTVYVTGLPDAPQDCRALSSSSNPHMPLVWNVAGVQGAVGAKGDKGDTGAKGEQGAQGVAGLKGEKGDQGIQGIAGPKGDKGDQGIQGIAGVKGDKGDTGATGARGLTGAQGVAGLAGIQRVSITANVDVARVSCPAGKKVLGGGYIAPSNGSILVQQSYPSSDDAWTVVVKNTGSARTNFEAWAVCAAVQQ